MRVGDPRKSKGRDAAGEEDSEEERVLPYHCESLLIEDRCVPCGDNRNRREKGDTGWRRLLQHAEDGLLVERLEELPVRGATPGIRLRGLIVEAACDVSDDDDLRR